MLWPSKKMLLLSIRLSFLSNLSASSTSSIVSSTTVMPDALAFIILRPCTKVRLSYLTEAIPCAASPSARSLNGVSFKTFSSMLLAPEPCTRTTAGTGPAVPSGIVRIPLSGYSVPSPITTFSLYILILPYRIYAYTVLRTIRSRPPKYVRLFSLMSHLLLLKTNL